MWDFKNNKIATETAKKTSSLYQLPSLKLVFKFSFWQYVFERWTQTSLDFDQDA